MSKAPLGVAALGSPLLVTLLLQIVDEQSSAPNGCAGAWYNSYSFMVDNLSVYDIRF
jgi:hypothetical protein